MGGCSGGGCPGPIGKKTINHGCGTNWRGDANTGRRSSFCGGGGVHGRAVGKHGPSTFLQSVLSTPKRMVAAKSEKCIPSNRGEPVYKRKS